MQHYIGEIAVVQHKRDITSKRRAAARRYREEFCQQQPVSATKHNMEQSGLYRLPPEILLLVGANLTGSSTLSLQASSRRFRLIIGASTAREANQRSSKRFLNYLKNDKFARDCASERRLWHNKDLKGCSGCRKEHPTNFFSPEELSKPPEARNCIGRTKVLRACDHKSLTFTEMENITKRMAQNGQRGRPICSAPEHSDRLRERKPWLTRVASEEYWYGITHQYLLFKTLRDQIVAMGPLHNVLARLNIQICPHSLSSVPNLFKLTQPYDNYVLYDKDFEARPGSKHLRSSCETPNCYTFFSLYVDYIHGGKNMVRIFLYVHRAFSISEGANDPTWLEQTLLQ
ncbi:uncharacterized protein K452DRAFT_305073 [Aplosporella prunicola CBS 121167]|uniref:F-box domain-containing protein n=1 Tax=Aplosporella prunicola CBS 121167 TaxID=1176127 RepID=A0A6A6BQ25_9PEZI|nr:uncharacterized protein K452DRAFT_305073 [Aplosporella prunicola CBS 121167]KAF2146090.1 hypothetical protein K452DRAFT_305073 [Aplosporella prunicola CBS 121167]